MCHVGDRTETDGYKEDDDHAWLRWRLACVWDCGYLFVWLLIVLLVCVINRVLGGHWLVVGLGSCSHGLLVVRREWREDEAGGDESGRRPWRPWWRRVTARETFWDCDNFVDSIRSYEEDRTTSWTSSWQKRQALALVTENVDLHPILFLYRAGRRLIVVWSRWNSSLLAFSVTWMLSAGAAGGMAWRHRVSGIGTGTVGGGVNWVWWIIPSQLVRVVTHHWRQ